MNLTWSSNNRYFAFGSTLLQQGARERDRWAISEFQHDLDLALSLKSDFSHPTVFHGLSRGLGGIVLCRTREHLFC